MNVKSSHMTKGHQTSWGKIIASGPYESAFSPFNFADQWKMYLKTRLQETEAGFQDLRNATAPKRDDPLTANDRILAYELHQTCMARFFRSYEGYNASRFTSLTTCYCCLMEVPEHPLQCGHVLCTGCVRAYGHQFDSHSMLMDYCPLHLGQRFDRPWIIHFKPDYAGVRILTLDGFVLNSSNWNILILTSTGAVYTESWSLKYLGVSKWLLAAKSQSKHSLISS